ncbi:MAG: sulfite exporter TauE/SafE family protein [Proteobacteria bacterium]|nr:sulfite exporter TauE/SafE family protein [Pseudomonadota bacterium]
MQIYLPIAEMSVNLFLLLGMGGMVGLLSGLFGVGGGFLMTPLLIFVGVPPAVAVGTEANQIVAASLSGVIAHWRRGNVDLRMGGMMVAGGFAGSALGTLAFRELREIGQAEAVIAMGFVVFLGAIGMVMLAESGWVMARRMRGTGPRRKARRHYWIHGLPLKMRFPRSRLYISSLLPLGMGFLGGLLAAIMGVGGGFFLIPAMIYVLGMPTAVAVGTSLFQIIFVTASVTVLHATNNHTVDVVLALLLLSGAVIGAQVGTSVGARLRGEHLRALLAVLVLAVGVGMAGTLLLTPADPYSVVRLAQ